MVAEARKRVKTVPKGCYGKNYWKPWSLRMYRQMNSRLNRFSIRVRPMPPSSRKVAVVKVREVEIESIKLVMHAARAKQEIIGSTQATNFTSGCWNFENKTTPIATNPTIK